MSVEATQQNLNSNPQIFVIMKVKVLIECIFEGGEDLIQIQQIKIMLVLYLV